MDVNTALLLSLPFICLYFIKCSLSNPFKPSRHLPPGPKPWPIIGNIFHLTSNPHRSLAALSKIHGPLMTLKLGSITAVIVSSVDVAKEVFQKHDMSFSSRPIQAAVKAVNHHEHSMGWLPVSPKWRYLRKISSVHLFTKQRLDSTQILRHKKLHEMLDYVGESCRNCEAVEIGKAAFTTTLNLLSNTIFSIDLASYSSSSSQEFKELTWSIMEALGKPNLADYFPLLGYFDPNGLKRDTEISASKYLSFIDDIIKKRLSSITVSSSLEEEDVLATLLKINKEDGSDLSIEDIKHLILDLFVAGTETTSSTIEWAMTELLHNPSKMEKVQAEMDEILDKNMSIQETDIGKLPYLQAVVKETLRLHPPAPFLLPHKAVNDVDLCSYVVPKGAHLLVNVWAIGHDPGTWKEPELFLPERFFGCEIDIKGHDFELIPFGSGRRMCPGLPLAYRMLHLVLATLLCSFNWMNGNGIRQEDMDMNEKLGMTLQKAKPLLAIPLPK